MSTISPNRFASPNSQTSAVNKEANPLNEDFNHAKRVMADEMKRLYPDSVMDTKSTLVTLDQQSLDHIVKNGTLRSANGDLARIFHKAGRRFRAEARCYWFSRLITTGIADAILYR